MSMSPCLSGEGVHPGVFEMDLGIVTSVSLVSLEVDLSRIEKETLWEDRKQRGTALLAVNLI